MQDAMYSALFGALTNEHRLNSIANNLANVNTTGYKRDLLSFKDTFALYATDVVMEAKQSIRSKSMMPDPKHIARARLAVAKTDFQQGGLKVTGAPFDVGISGEGFFRLQTPDGVFYTRNGHFRLTAEGTVISEQGWPVVGAGGPITVPPGFKSVTIAEDGRLFADGALIDQISLVGVDNPDDLEKQGRNLFRARPNTEIAENAAEGSWMAQGFLEAANVDAVYEMVNMIEAQRQFEAYQKVMQTSDAIDREATTKVGRGRA